VLVRLAPGSSHWRASESGQQATFTDASRVLVLNVRNREANPSAGGHFESFTVMKLKPESGRSFRASGIFFIGDGQAPRNFFVNLIEFRSGRSSR
jgi:hypothetical protein